MKKIKFFFEKPINFSKKPNFWFFWKKIFSVAFYDNVATIWWKKIHYRDMNEYRECNWQSSCKKTHHSSGTFCSHKLSIRRKKINKMSKIRQLQSQRKNDSTSGMTTLKPTVNKSNRNLRRKSLFSASTLNFPSNLNSASDIRWNRNNQENRTNGKVPMQCWLLFHPKIPKPKIRKPKIPKPNLPKRPKYPRPKDPMSQNTQSKKSETETTKLNKTLKAS